MIASTKPRRATAVAALLFAAIATSRTLAQAEAPPIRGVAEPARRVMLHAPLDGVLGAVEVAEGDRVEAGDVLARMEDAVQRAQVEIASIQAESEARVRQAGLRLEEATTRYERVREAAENNAAEAWEVRQALLQKRLAAADKEAAEEELAVAQARLKLERQRLEMYRLTAPWPGVVHRVEAEAGATLTRRDPVVELIQVDQLKVELFLPIELMSRLRRGAVYRLKVDPPLELELTATLDRFERVVDAASGTFRAVFIVDNSRHDTPAGVGVELPWPQAPAMPKPDDKAASD